MSENFRPNVCGKYALQGSSRALYTPLDPTHKQCTWPVPFYEVGCAVLIWTGAVMDGSLWADLIWWSGLTMVWCGSWCMVWSVAGSETHLIVCCGGLICGGSYSLPMWSGSTAYSEGLTEEDGLLWRLKIKNMKSWGNSSEKALNASESYAKKRNEEKIRKYFILQIQLQSNTLMPWKALKRLSQTNTGLCWRSFRIFSICIKDRIL